MTLLSPLFGPTARRSFLAALLLLAAALHPAAADDTALNDLRARGVVAERYDGYVMVRDPSGGAAAQAVVDRVNAERRAIYEARAKEQGVSADQVGQVYAGQIIQKAPPGTWFLAVDGSWTRK
jgi:uncharacterized protein YdbL (DUF1318 family)